MSGINRVKCCCTPYAGPWTQLKRCIDGVLIDLWYPGDVRGQVVKDRATGTCYTGFGWTWTQPANVIAGDLYVLGCLTCCHDAGGCAIPWPASTTLAVSSIQLMTSCVDIAASSAKMDRAELNWTQTYSDGACNYSKHYWDGAAGTADWGELVYPANGCAGTPVSNNYVVVTWLRYLSLGTTYARCEITINGSNLEYPRRIFRAWDVAVSSTCTDAMVLNNEYANWITGTPFVWGKNGTVIITPGA